MGNKIFESILTEKIDIFKTAFEKTSTDLFWDEDNKKLIHPGEYGMYREEICKEFLRIVTPHRLDIGNGFLINSQNEISTQCDIIIYDSRNTARIENSTRQRFFPVETTVGIGEIKSTLSKYEFGLALNKLAQNKSLREKIQNPASAIGKSFSSFSPTSVHTDALFSFLICKKLDFDTKNLAFEINEFYNEEIKDYQKHNLILSLEDGICAYYDDRGKTIMYPYMSGKKLMNRFVKPGDNPYCHFDFFASYYFIGISSVTTYFPEITDYLGRWTGGWNNDEKY